MIRAITKVRPASSRTAEQGIPTQRCINLDGDSKMNKEQDEKVRVAFAVASSLCGCYGLSLPNDEFLSSKIILTGMAFTFAYMLFFEKGIYNPRLVKKCKQWLAKKPK
ncbi:hypothetical protein [Pseudomonas sp. HPB0071]|uniref:hypothetical protein n=2 Tax=Pseudomonas TaxID=286 RepID=UPI00056348B2|nr:hypothetical protein [Pseudomonas sp. HPB0071]